MLLVGIMRLVSFVPGKLEIGKIFCFTLVSKEHKVKYIFTYSEYYTRSLA